MVVVGWPAGGAFIRILVPELSLFTTKDKKYEEWGRAWATELPSALHHGALFWGLSRCGITLQSDKMTNSVKGKQTFRKSYL